MNITSVFVVDYPLYIVVGLMDYGPHIWSFETSQDVSAFMWGRSFSRYAIFKNRKLFRAELETGDVKELERLLEEFE